MKKHVVIGLLISAGCLYVALRGISWQDVRLAFESADPRWFGLAVLLYPTCYLARTLRWTVLMKPVQDVAARRLFNPLVLGFFGNTILPFRMGELLRAHIAGRKLGISRTAAFGTIVLERLSDATSFLVIFLIIAFLFPFPASVQRAAWGMGAGCVVFMACLALFVLYPTQAQALLARLPLPDRIREKIHHLLTNFTKGLSGLRLGSVFCKLIPLSMGVWFLEGTTVYLVIRAFPNQVTYAGAFFVMFFMGLSSTLPQAPGYVGTMELFGTTALSILGVPREAGLPIMLAIHGMQFIMISILGLIALGSEGLTLGALSKSTLDSPSDS